MIEKVIPPFIIIVALLIGARQTWHFGHRGNYGELVARYKVKRDCLVGYKIPWSVYIGDRKGNWRGWWTFSVAYEDQGLYLGHVFFFRPLVPAILIDWEHIRYRGEKERVFVFKKIILEVKDMDILIALPAWHQLFLKKWVTIID